MLNTQSPMPLYHQLAEIIISRIQTGEYAPGARIPSENELARTYGIGRPTVRQAIDLVVRRRMLIRKRGSGTFVRIQEKEVDLFSLAGTTSAFHRKGISVKTQIVSKIRRKPITDNPDNPFYGKEAYFYSRLSRVEGKPVLIEDLYLHPELFANIDKIELSDRSLAQVVAAHYYMRPTSGKQNFRIGFLEGKRAAVLELLPTEPVLTVKRFLNFAQTENAIYSELFCRTDRFVFSQEIGGISND